MTPEILADIIKSSKYIVALTGAGISTNAGIPDFRSKQGIYATKKYRPEIFDIEYFMKDPSLFYDYAYDFFSFEKDISPTFAHYFLAALEKAGKLKTIITQNIDGLHRKAGSKNIIEIHGGFDTGYCTLCLYRYNFSEIKNDILKRRKIPKCQKCKGVIKPDVVFFGEPVKDMEKAISEARKSDLMLVIGTSLTVYPAAYIPESAVNKIAILNKGEIGKKYPNAIIFQEDIDTFLKNISEMLNIHTHNQ